MVTSRSSSITLGTAVISRNCVGSRGTSAAQAQSNPQNPTAIQVLLSKACLFIPAPFVVCIRLRNDRSITAQTHRAMHRRGGTARPLKEEFGATPRTRDLTASGRKAIGLLAQIVAQGTGRSAPDEAVAQQRAASLDFDDFGELDVAVGRLQGVAARLQAQQQNGAIKRDGRQGLFARDHVQRHVGGPVAVLAAGLDFDELNIALTWACSRIAATSSDPMPPET